jgi:endonuclease III
MAQTIKKDSNIPLDLETLTALPGIGRKICQRYKT